MENLLLKGVILDNKIRSMVQDARLTDVYHHNYAFDLPPYEQLSDWSARRDQLREDILISAGLWPLPDKCELRPKVFDKIEYDGFTVEKVLFESIPGFYVTGNLYRPKGRKGPFPAILNPHGHWENGRLEMTELAEIPTRCANFSKMGFIAFSYDMVGFLDSQQFDHGFGGPEKELWGEGLLGLQLWNSIRSLDFLLTLPDADPEKIGCTGASGGGSQTFLLGAVDERLKVCAPVNMISADMQGGCKCENAPYLRINQTTNVEFSAMFAPRPMLMVGCTGDWTKNIPNREFPYIQTIYELYGASEMVDYYYMKADHNYNKSTREAVYKWFRLHFHGVSKQWDEEKIDFGDLDRFRIFPWTEPATVHLTGEQVFSQVKQEKINRLKLARSSGQRVQLEPYFKALKFIMGQNAVPHTMQASIEEFYYGNELKPKDSDQIAIDQYVITSVANSVNIPVSILKNKSFSVKSDVVLFVHPKGTNGLIDDPYSMKAANDWLQMGYQIATADVFLTGAYMHSYAQSGRNTTLDQYFTTYNYSDAVCKVQDIVHIYKFLLAGGYDKVHVVGLYEAGLWVLGALPFMESIHCAVVDLNNFNFDSDEQYATRFFVPHFKAIGGFEICFNMLEPKVLKLFQVPRLAKDSILGHVNLDKTEVQIYETLLDSIDLSYEYAG